MRPLLHILFLFAISAYCNAKEATQMNDVQKLGLKGNVKSYAQYATKVADGTLTKDYLKKITYFDERGNKVESVTYNRNKELTGRTKSKIAPKGKVLEEKVYNQKGEETTKTANKYDKKGRLQTSAKIDQKGDTISFWCYTYDKKGRKLSSTYKDKQKVLATGYGYDKKSNITEMNIYQNQQLKRKENFSYDTEGRLTAWTKYNGKDSTLNIQTKYNSWGTQTYKLTTLNGAPLEMYYFEYDKSKNNRAIFHYNDKINPNALEEESGKEERDQSLIDIEYIEYDHKNNKTRRQKIKNGETIEGEINEITYY